jgi:hypothetical protein
MSKLMTNLQIIQREKFCQGSRRRSKREICCFGAYLLGTVLSPLLRQKMRRRKALAAMAMMDDVTKPAPINQWVSASIYRLQEENEQMKGNARAHSHLFWFWEAPTKHE